MNCEASDENTGMGSGMLRLRGAGDKIVEYRAGT